MSNKQHFSITTGDPRFDPNEKVIINGFVFVPEVNGGVMIESHPHFDFAQDEEVHG